MKRSFHTDGKKYELKLVRAYTGEALNVVYRIGDTYIPDALYKLNDFLRDSHNEEVSDYDPRTFDVLHTMLAKLGKTDSAVNILSAYRTQETNDMLRESGTTNAALHSQHIEAKALDLRVPGVPAVKLRDAALSLSAGGVGYYPKSWILTCRRRPGPAVDLRPPSPSLPSFPTRLRTQAPRHIEAPRFKFIYSTFPSNRQIYLRTKVQIFPLRVYHLPQSKPLLTTAPPRP